MDYKKYIYKGIETNYIVYNNGKVLSKFNNKFLSPYKSSSGYLTVDLYINGNRVKKMVHQLVAEMFVENALNKPTINHIDGNKLNNHYTNLEWVTQSENNLHALEHNLRHPCSGENVHFAKYNSLQVIRACEEMQNDKKSMAEISEITNIPTKILYEIRSRHIWKDISKHYSFPETSCRTSKKSIFQNEIKRNIMELLELGVSTKDICKDLGIEPSRKNKKSIYDLKWNMDPSKRSIKLNTYMKNRIKHNKLDIDQRSTNGLDNSLDGIEEYFILLEDLPSRVGNNPEMGS